MKLRLDPTRCQGYGLCQEPAPDLIDIDDFGYASVVADPAPGTSEDAARAAVEACPNSALRLER
ncbi:ferredoxin [Streptomyces kronopolitis]|uniref:Ferredoxin n=1 Tax=Streptomyces kronopolitis TaxID=1612435 RepID=A0ABQ2JVM4_9ACTN|nr:ferredoxin [Streptomyces kronopolitis]MCL6301684.1 ferredoxin [Streptomyces kronopolitis]GGN57051.1 hypothetical protein GCM10012285_52160 [Streptomyces kronopolitis]